MRTVPAVVCVLAAGAVLASCSGEGGSGAGSTATAAPTVTVTVTVTPTPSASTSTTSGFPTSGATGPTTVAPSGTTSAPTSQPPFSRALAEEDLANVVADIGVLDTQLAQGGSLALRLRVLAAHFAALTADGVPPGLDGPSYRARLASLEIFAGAAADEATSAPLQAAARYEVIRTETGVLLTQVNGALGTTYALPPRGGATTVPTSPGGTGATAVPVPTSP